MSSELKIAIPGISEDLYASIVPSGLSYGLSSEDVSNGISLISQLGIEGFEVCTYVTQCTPVAAGTSPVIPTYVSFIYIVRNVPWIQRCYVEHPRM